MGKMRGDSRWRPAVQLVVLVSLVVTVTWEAWAARPRLFGYVKPILWVGLADPYAVRGLARLQLGVQGGEGAGISYYGSLDMEVDDSLLFKGTDAAGRGGASFFPVEAYVRYSVGPLDLKVGKQFIFWGQADWVNPTDVLCAWDHLNVSSEIEDYRIATWAIRAQAFAGPLTFDLVLVPLGLPHRFGGAGSAAGSAGAGRSGGQPTEVKRYEPQGTIDDAEAGLRVGFSLAGFDLHLMGYWGLDKYPTVRVSPKINPTTGKPEGMLVQQSHDRVIVVGGDVSRPFGSLMIKAEAAWHRTDDTDGKDPSQPNPHVDGVLGLGYTISNDMKLSLQYILVYRLAYDLAAEDAYRKQAGLTTNTPQAATHSASLNLSWKILSRLELQLTSVLSISDPSLFILGFVNVELVDGLRLYVGTVAFVGPTASQWGMLRPYSRVFTELKYSF